MDDFDPTAVENLDDLAACLRYVHLRADKPTLRVLEQQTVHANGFLPGTGLKRARLTRSTLGDVLSGRKFPRKAFMLTFVEACGIDLENDHRWEQAWNRLAPRYHQILPPPAGELERLRQENEELRLQANPARRVAASTTEVTSDRDGRTTAVQVYDLGLIIPTQEEFDYIRGSVPLTLMRDEDHGFWYEFPVPGGRLGVAHLLYDMGLTATTAATTVAAIRLLARFGPEVLAVVGIGGSLSTELRLGDVVVGSVIQEYLKAARIAPDGNSRTVFQPVGDGWPLAGRLRNFVKEYRYFDEDSYRSWVRFARLRAVEADLPLPTAPGARADPAYFVQPIASGDLVVTDPAFKDWVLSHDRKQALIEMEGAGAARAVKEYDRDVALIVLRGISDFADGRKAALDAVAGRTLGPWCRYAAENAIELLFAFLASPNFPWRTPTP